MKEDQIIGGTDGDGNPEFVEDLPIHPAMKDVYAFIANAKTTKTKMISDIIILEVLADELNEDIHKLYQS